MEGADKEIREIERELAVAERRLKRFKQTMAEIQSKNRANLEDMGLESTRDLEGMIKARGVHPGGMDMFRTAMAEKERVLPEFLQGMDSSISGGDSGQNLDLGSAPAETVKKKKRFKIRL